MTEEAERNEILKLLGAIQAARGYVVLISQGHVPVGEILHTLVGRNPDWSLAASYDVEGGVRVIGQTDREDWAEQFGVAPGWIFDEPPPDAHFYFYRVIAE